MAVSQERPKRKVTGSTYKSYRKKKFSNLGRSPTNTKLGENKIRNLRIRNSNVKKIILSINEINVYDPKSKKYKKAKIKTVIESPANRHFVRRNIITRGAIVDTDIGKAKITSRPGQDPVLNGILIE